MKKLLLIILLSSPCLAGGPKYNYEDPHLNDEMNNIYKDIGHVLKGSKNAINLCGYVIGTIVQVVSTKDTSNTVSVGTAYTATATAGTLTPKCATDIISIEVSGTLGDIAFATSGSYLTVFKDSSDLDTTGNGFAFISSNATNTVSQVPASINTTNSPGSTSSVTYTVKIKSDVAAKTQWSGGGTGTIVLKEIAQ